MSDGTEQRERFPGALEDGYFLVDETPFEHLVAMSADLAAKLRFFDLNQRENGTWRDMFASDESLVLARIASIDRQALLSAFQREAEAAPLAQLAREVVRLANWMDLWFKSLAASKQRAAQALRERIEQLVEQQLAAELDWVHRRFGEQRWEGRAIAYSKPRLDPIWTPRRVTQAPQAHRSERERLRSVFFALLSAVARVQALANELLPQTLATPAHEPAAGLLMAFLQVYGWVQQQINRFTDRHIDFYYRECLGLRPQPAAPDSAHLACRRDTRAAREVVVPGGTAFVAGKDAAGRAIEFRCDEPLVVTDARVAALCTLRLERDELISPEREFDFVTRAKATRIEPPAGTLTTIHWPLFGGSLPGSSSAATEDARIGLAITTPLLLLKEGEREIHVTLRFAPGTERDALLVESAVNATTRSSFFSSLGRVFRRWLFADADPLSESDLERLRRTARRLLGVDVPSAPGPGDPLCLLFGEHRPARELIFDQLLNGIFDVGLTVVDGWYDAAQVQVRRAPVVASAPGGVQLIVRLRAEDAPIVACETAVHGAQWPTRLPILRLQLCSRDRMYAYSLFEGLVLAEAAVAVKVAGVRDLLLHNNLGRLDASKPFHPFGPLPTLSSYMVFGARELARKNVQALSLRIEWGGLPTEVGGFDSHYRGYGPEYGNDAFTAALAILRDGQWQHCGGASARQPLFAGLDTSGRLRPLSVIEVDAGSVRKHCRASSEAPVFDLGARNGFFRLQLTEPLGAFGHAAYPALLAQGVTANAKRKRPLPLPNAPYTPLVERFTLDYEARSTIRLGRDSETAEDGDAERVLHLHPFGIAEPYRESAGAEHGVLPRMEHDGNLYIGIAATELQGPLKLLFHLRDETAVEPLDDRARPAITWSTLVSNRWRALPPSRVMSDTTDGFLSSGIVTLDLPPGMDRASTLLPAGLYWLRVSADRGFDRFAGLYGVHAQGLCVTRLLHEEMQPNNAPASLLGAGTIAQPVASVAGLAGVAQVGASFGLRLAEDTRRFRARAGERLRHKNRVSTAWDAERLVLEHFPEVGKVKCLSAHEFGGAPGEVLVVVVPTVRRNDPQASTLAPRLNAIALQRIAEFVSGRASPFAQVAVRNAAYERLQVRCSVQLHRGTQAGLALRCINEAIVEYLSPWHDRGYQARFDWVARCEDIEARLRELDEVAAVARLSLLDVARSDDGVYTLGDTARDTEEGVATGAGNQLHARSPWSIALPMREHMIDIADELADAAPQATGIARLAVGSTFIVGRSAP